MNWKKIALIVAFLAITVGIGYFMYRLFFGGAPSVPTEVPEEVPGAPTTGLPSAGGAQPTVPGAPAPVGLPAADEVARGRATQTQSVSGGAAVLEPIITTAGNLNYYNRDDGKFYRQLDDGTLAALSEKTFPFVQNVEWAPAGDKAVLEFPDDRNIIFDFSQQKQITLPQHWEDFDFSGDGRSIAAKSISEDPANSWLITFDASGQNAQLIEPIGDQGDKVIVDFSPDNSVVAFSDTAEPAGFDTHDQLLIGRNGENFKALRVEGFGFTPLWSPDGKNLLYSAAGAADEYVPNLWFSGAKGQEIGTNRTRLNILTWADKCTFADNETVYCAVPDGLPEGAGLQRDVADGIFDHIEKIDLRSGINTRIGRPAVDTSISTVLVSPDGSKLFFTNASTGVLEEMRLK